MIIGTDDYAQRWGEDRTQWVVVLSDGTTVRQDDDRPDTIPHDGWSRLKLFCEKNDLHVVDIYIRFRDHTVPLPSGKDGYFFVKSVMAFLNGGQNIHSYAIGYLEGNNVMVKKYKVPELVEVESETRPDYKCEYGLIRRKKWPTTS